MKTLESYLLRVTPEQQPGESTLAYSIRIADSISQNYEWAPLGSVPQEPIPRGLFAPFEYSALRTMLQRKQLTQADFDRLANISDDDACRVRQWLYELLSTYGPKGHGDGVLHNIARWDFSLRICSLGDKLSEHPVDELFGCCEQRILWPIITAGNWR